MNEKVQAFIDQQEYLKKLQEQKYHYLVAEYAGLMKDEADFIEVTKEEYNEALYVNASNAKSEDGKYFAKKRLPLKRYIKSPCIGLASECAFME